MEPELVALFERDLEVYRRLLAETEAGRRWIGETPGSENIPRAAEQIRAAIRGLEAALAISD
jgi:hypothetical protein